MVRTVVLDPREPEPFRVLIDRIENPRPLLRRIGTLVESSSQRSFQLQGLGSIRWEPRYPNQGDPFINIAGAVSDWNKGPNVKGRRFDRRPALIDTGALQGSIASRPRGDDEVEVGSALPYASDHQHGLVSVLRVTKQAKKRIARFLLTPRGREYRGKLMFLLNPNVNTIDTEIVARPFVGLTDVTQIAITDATEEYVAEGSV